MSALHTHSLAISSPAVIARSTAFSQPRVAIVHYWLIAMRGGERVVERLLKLFPQADIFTHVYDEKAMSNLINSANIKTSFISDLPFAKKAYQYYLPLMPMALEQLNLRGYDIVISSESGPAKGVITDPSSLHVCYCHSPMRYLWDHYHLYRDQANPIVKAIMPYAYHKLRQWDYSTSARVDKFAANSRFIRDRIRKNWRRDAEVIHPPVETDLFSPSDTLDDNYLWVGQLVPYKRPDLAVDAFNRLGLPLVMVGTGGMKSSLVRRAGPNIRFIDRLNFIDLRRAYARAKALIFTAEEDFGIVPVEAMASGRPVLAFGRGGVLDSVVAGKTGVFFEEQTVESLVVGVEQMEYFLSHFDPAVAISQSKNFAPEVFDSRMRNLIES